MTNDKMTHILLVDDEDSFRLSLEMALKMTDQFSVRSCASGDDCVEILKKDTFDVILLDNRMEGMSGLDVLHWMHSQEIQTPTIMITAAGSEAVAVEAMKLGVYDYLRKDQLDIDRLRIAIKSVLERYQYRMDVLQRDAEKRLLKEKQKELDSLRLYHTTVNSVGQLLEKNLMELGKNLEGYEKELTESVEQSAQARLKDAFREIRHDIEVISSGVASMRGLSSVVTNRLDAINLVPKAEETKKN
jgi:DNA-binding response OmpR family regulator